MIEKRAHAILSASSASIWLNCTPAPRLAATFESKSSSYADEGRLAHKLAELKSQLVLEKITPTAYKKSKALLAKDELYSEEMLGYINGYVDYIIERVNAAGEGAAVLLEQRLNYSKWVQSGFGTGDVVIVSLLHRYVEVIDLKYGKGVPVDAAGNAQLRLYGLGAYYNWSALYDVAHITMTIVQPRLDSISSETLAVEELLDWAEMVVKPRAAAAWLGQGDYVPGKHCKFCGAGAMCTARARYCAELDFGPPQTLTVAQVVEYLGKVDQIKAWVTTFREYTLDQALAGKEYPGWKIVEGTSRRKITDENKAADALMGAGYAANEIYKPMELQGITNLEKLCGKQQFNELVGGLLAKPPGKPTLVPESDQRPVFNSAAQDFKGVNIGKVD